MRFLPCTASPLKSLSMYHRSMPRVHMKMLTSWSITLVAVAAQVEAQKGLL